jgi:hypothetical protein
VQYSEGNIEQGYIEKAMGKKVQEAKSKQRQDREMLAQNARLLEYGNARMNARLLESRIARI